MNDQRPPGYPDDSVAEPVMPQGRRVQSRTAAREHQPGCPRLQFWDAGEWDAPCLCEEAYEEPPDDFDELVGLTPDMRWGDGYGDG